MSLTLYVDGPRWRAHQRSVLDAPYEYQTRRPTRTHVVAASNGPVGPPRRAR